MAYNPNVLGSGPSAAHLVDGSCDERVLSNPVWVRNGRADVKVESDDPGWAHSNKVSLHTYLD